MPDLSEMVMRWLGDWPDDKDESTQRQKARQKKKETATKSDASQHPKRPFSDVTSQVRAADNSKDNGSSASGRKNRKRKKK